MASGFLSPPKWDEGSKSFDMWLREAKAWKVATAHVTGLKDVHGLQLALHLPEGSEIRNQLFDTLDEQEMSGDDGWKQIIDLMSKYYKKDENTDAFDTWKRFRSLARLEGQTIDDYIMVYEQCKTKLKRYKMEITERIHGMNLLCGAHLTDEELRIAMRDVDDSNPNGMYEDAKKSLKKYYGKCALTSLEKSVDQLAIKQEVFFGSQDSKDTHMAKEFEAFLAWKQRRTNNYRNKDGIINKNSRNYQTNNNNTNREQEQGRKNPKGADGKNMQCHICKCTFHFARSCPYNTNNMKNSGEEEKSNETFFTHQSPPVIPDQETTEEEAAAGAADTVEVVNDDVIECDASDVKVGESLNSMVVDTGCPENVAGIDWYKCYTDCLSEEQKSCIKQSTSDNKLRFGKGPVFVVVFC